MICPIGCFGKNCDTQTPPCPIEDSRYRLMHNRCFYFEKEELTFEAAKANCKEKGGKLYEPKDVTKMKEIAKISDGIRGTNPFVWIGITDSAVEGNFVYDSDGANINFNPTWHGNYGAKGTSYNCICTGTKSSDLGKVGNLQCSWRRPSICESNRL